MSTDSSYTPQEEDVMTANAQTVLDNAMKLSDDDRAALTDELLASLDPDPGENDPLAAEDFLAELDRRATELQLDSTVGIPWDVVKNLR